MYFVGVNTATFELPTYVIGDPTEFSTGIVGLFETTGFDTPAGQMIVFLTVFVVGSGAMWWFKFPPVAHSVWFLFVGGFIISVVFSAGVASGFFVLLFTISVPLVVIFGLLGQKISGSSALE
jgi:hypothetical protein